MGLFYFGAIFLYLGMVVAGVILFIRQAIQSRTISLWVPFGACMAALIAIPLLSQYGLLASDTRGDYFNMGLIWDSLVRWHSLVMAAVIVGPAFRKGSHPILVGTSFGLTVSAGWWLWHILSMTK